MDNGSAEHSAGRRLLLEACQVALAAAGGEQATREALRRSPTGPCHVVAVGKAAAAMLRGASAALGDDLRRALLITKRGHVGSTPRITGGVEVIEAGHPVPDEASLQAGEALLRFIEQTPAGAPMLFLVSGGTSALVERLPESLGLEQLRQINDWLLASGLPIDAVNRVRKRLSCLKAGRLASYLGGRGARVLLISDVPDDDPKVIGSGMLAAQGPGDLELPAGLPRWLRAFAESAPPPLAPNTSQFSRIQLEIIASNRKAQEAVISWAHKKELAVTFHGELFQGDAISLGRQMAAEVLATPGLSVWGGESTVLLPENPGRGGRNQSLALAAATVLTGHCGLWLAALGTDGTDGLTDDAGGLVDGGTLERGRDGAGEAEMALKQADAGTFLELSGDLLHTGPTGTNVMDLVLGLNLSPGVKGPS